MQGSERHSDVPVSRDAPADEFAKWLLGAGSVAQKMLLYGRNSLELAVQSASPAEGVFMTVWLFDGAGLSVFRCPGGAYDRVTAKEFFDALARPSVKQLVGTTPEDFLESLKQRLQKQANTLRDADASDIVAKCRSGRSPAAIAADEYRAYEEEGPPKPFDMGGIAVRASQAWWAGFTMATDVEHRTFDAHHGFWQQLFRFLGKKRYAKHWATCTSCRRVVEELLQTPDALFGRLASRASEAGYECEGLNTVRSSPELTKAHIASCVYCETSILTATEHLADLLYPDRKAD